MTVPVASPCTNVCRMDPMTHWCQGCLRTIPEITAWSRCDADAKRAVWSALAARRASAEGQATLARGAATDPESPA